MDGLLVTMNILFVVSTDSKTDVRSKSYRINIDYRQWVEPKTSDGGVYPPLLTPEQVEFCCGVATRDI